LGDVAPIAGVAVSNKEMGAYFHLFICTSGVRYFAAPMGRRAVPKASFKEKRWVNQRLVVTEANSILTDKSSCRRNKFQIRVDGTRDKGARAAKQCEYSMPAI
jgi:hypothetical protein